MDTQLRQSTVQTLGSASAAPRQDSLMVCLQETVQTLNEVSDRLDQMNTHLIGPRPSDENKQPIEAPASLMQWAQIARVQARHIANETLAMQSVL